MTARGFPLSSDIASRHAKHRHEYASKQPTAVEKRDIAKLLQQRMGDALATMDDSELFAKDNQAAIGNALKAQVALDKREQSAKKQTQADVLVSLLAALRGEGAPVLALDDGKTIEGDFVALD